MEKTLRKQLVLSAVVLCSVACGKAQEKSGPMPEPDEVTDLSSSGTANCYIVSAAGSYRFPAVRGNSRETVGAVVSAEVLWETFGTDVAPAAGDLIPEVGTDGKQVSFRASDRKGNAVIAAKDADGNILWSWHIWMTDRPEDQVYNNDAGTMMDRNLGAVSAVPGDVGALGLLYQWGRKDPFLNSSSIAPGDVLVRAESTIAWPAAVDSDRNTGTIAYAVAHPTTFIACRQVDGNPDVQNNADWFYTGNNSTDDTRWQTSKTIYDPCPPGYRVPDVSAGEGVWAKAFGPPSDYGTDSYVSSTGGCNFGSTGEGELKLSDSVPVCWYPTAGSYGDDGTLYDVGKCGFYVSSSPSYSGYISIMYLYTDVRGIKVTPWINAMRVYGCSVRCLKE